MSAVIVPTRSEINAAWIFLPAETQRRIGLLALDMVWQAFLSGDAYAPEDYVLRDEDERGAASDLCSKALTELHIIIEDALPVLFGLPGEDPTWAQSASVMAHAGQGV